MDPKTADRLEYLIEVRQSCRAPFDPDRHVGPQQLARIVNAARWAPTAHNMQNFELVVVDDRAKLDELGAIRTTISPAFIAENYRQLSWSQQELEERGTGLLATMFPRTWWTPDPTGVTNTTRLLGESIAGAPMVIVVVYDASLRAPASEGDVLGMISLGCVLENMWLSAQAEHLDAQVVSAFAGDAEPEVRRVLTIPPPWRIAYALRLGHAIAARSRAPRVRRLPERFVHRNGFPQAGRRRQ